MSAMTKPSSEMLVLHRGENEEIFVDSALHQHHIDGIRFLYRQFKKKRQGVIINNPLGYGNSLQVALFLGAIRELLEKPMLILCEQSEEMTWLEHFQKLTQCYNVGVDAPSPFVKKSIFINTLERLELFCRRDWSVLVVDTDDFLKEKALQAKFNADFKIWITPVDMKENLKTLSSIFKWLFPKDKLDINEFEAKPGDINDAVSKSIRLEAFLEDIVCRTTLQTPFENPYDKFEDTPRKSSKKNKDATGTKIKRSKRSLDVASTSNAPEAKESDTGAPAVKIPKTDNVSNDVSMSNYSDYDEDDDKADIESFIRDKEPISFCPYKDFESSQDSRLEFMDDEPILNTAERLNLLLQTHVPMDIAQNPEICFLDSDSTSDSLLPIPKSFDQLSNDSSYEERKVVTPEFLTDNILNEIKEEMYETHVSIFEDKDDVVKKSNKQDEIKSERESDTVNGKLDLEKEDSLIDKEDPDNLKEESDNDKDVDKDMEDSVKVVGDQNAVKGKLTDVEEMSDKDKEEPDKVTKESDKVKDSPIKQDLDSKIREMDERAFKKFQGSILDSLF